MRLNWASPVRSLICACQLLHSKLITAMLIQAVQVLALLASASAAPKIHPGPSESKFGLVVSTEIGLRSISLPDKTVTILSDQPSRGVSFNGNLKKAFFSDFFYNDASVASVSLDGRDLEKLFTWPSGYFTDAVQAIAVDERTNEVYFSTPRGVNRCNSNILFCKVISTPDLVNDVLSIALNPSQGTIYWVNRGTRENLGSIIKANIDGSNATVIISEIAFDDWPRGITVDEDRILWTHTTIGLVHTSTIHTSDLEGRNHQVLLQLPTPSNVYKVVAHEDRLYLADRDNMKVYSVNKYDGSDPEDLATGLRVTGVDIYSI